jgi:hypothetical protein
LTSKLSIQYIFKLSLASLDNDATCSACYDRIIVALGILASQRLGRSREAIRTHAEELAFMKNFVKTVHGISKDNCRGTVFYSLFGTDQGSGASPAVWLVLVTVPTEAIESFTTPEVLSTSKSASTTFSIGTRVKRSTQSSSHTPPHPPILPFSYEVRTRINDHSAPFPFH